MHGNYWSMHGNWREEHTVLCCLRRKAKLRETEPERNKAANQVRDRERIRE